MLPGPISEIVPGCLRCVALATRSLLLYLVHAGNSVDRIVWRRGVLGYAFAPSMMLGLFLFVLAVVLVASRLL
jgi:hypothetical protein